MNPLPRLEAARECYRRRLWREAHDLFTEMDRAGRLGAEDLERLARCADLLGDPDGFREAMERAHHAYLDADEPLRAARAAFWIGMQLAESGSMGRASGWLGRAGRLAEGRESVEEGYMLLAGGFREFAGGDLDRGCDLAGRAVAIAQRYRDRDLLALALHLRGRALVRSGRVEDGLALLDEAMVAVASDELSPHVTGLVYCSVISACRDVYALRRAWEWTAALSDWCDRHHDLVAYTDECRVHRAEIMLVRGEWRNAIAEAKRAAAAGNEGAGRAVSAASLYQQGEGHRLLGEFAAAEEAYREASRLGREPQPGLALLRLAQGDSAAAAGTLRRALADSRDTLRRARLLPAHVDVMLATGDLDAAEAGAEELETLAERVATAYVVAAAAHARGSVHLARGRANEACGALRRACRVWQDLQAPYLEARTREALARACRDAGDDETAALEIEAARTLYRALEAAPDLARLDPSPRFSAHGLTPRERQVLALVATGMTNRAIGNSLFISERTVARHVSNILAKLGLSSRAAATAYAYEHDLLEPPTQN